MGSLRIVFAASLVSLLAACGAGGSGSYRAAAAQLHRAAGRLAVPRAQQLVDASIPMSTDRERSMDLHVRVRNKSAKTIAEFDAILAVYDGARRIGNAQLTVTRSIPPGATLFFPYPIPYARFGDGTANVRNAAGKPKHLLLEVTRVRYTDRSGD